MQWSYRVLVALLLCTAAGCARDVSLQTSAAPSTPRWEDGHYLGVNDVPTPQLIRVAVGITQGRIVTIQLLEHPAWSAPTEQDRLLRLVVASQTTAGHVPRGTGSEQEHLLQAIDNALSQARPGAPATP